MDNNQCLHASAKDNDHIICCSLTWCVYRKRAQQFN